MIGLITLLLAWTMLFIFIDHFGLKQKRILSNVIDLSSVAVIVCARNESKRIEKCIHSLVSQKGAEFAEIAVIDDHSDDGTFQIVKRMIEELPSKQIRLYSLEEKSGKKEAIRTGLNVVSSEWIYFTDADCLVSERLLLGFARELEDNIKIGLGPVLNAYDKGIYYRLLQVEQVNNMMTTRAFVNINHPIMANGANLLLHSSLINQYLNALDSNTAGGDDVFFIQQVAKDNVGIKWCDSALVHTHHPSGLVGILNQRLRWASKASRYPSLLAKAISGLMFLLSCAFIFTIFIPLVAPPSAIWIALFWLLKIVIEFGFHNKWCNHWQINHNPFNAIVLSVCYPFYVCLIALGAFLGINFKWKGRNYAK